MTPFEPIGILCSLWTLPVSVTQGHASSFSIVAAVPTVNPTQIGLLVGGILVLLVVTARHRRSRTAASLSISRSDQRRGRPSGDQTIREVEAVMAQLDQLSRQIHGKIDLKLATLQTMIRDADQRIEQLSRLQREERGLAAFDVELESEAPDNSKEGIEHDPHDAIYRLADSGYTPLQIAKELARHTGEVELILSLRRAKRSSELNSPGFRKQAG